MSEQKISSKKIRGWEERDPDELSRPVKGNSGSPNFTMVGHRTTHGAIESARVGGPLRPSITVEDRTKNGAAVPMADIIRRRRSTLTRLLDFLRA